MAAGWEVGGGSSWMGKGGAAHKLMGGHSHGRGAALSVTSSPLAPEANAFRSPPRSHSDPNLDPHPRIPPTYPTPVSHPSVPPTYTPRILPHTGTPRIPPHTYTPRIPPHTDTLTCSLKPVQPVQIELGLPLLGNHCACLARRPVAHQPPDYPLGPATFSRARLHVLPLGFVARHRRH